MKISARFWFFLGLLGSSLTVAQAQIVTFNATLDGAQETPSVTTAGTGSGTLTFNSGTGAWSLSGTFTGLTGLSNNAHIHGPAAIGAGPAGIIAGITFDSNVTSGNFSGSGTFSLPANDLMNGLYYINIHSTFAGGGEIRGQLIPVPEPGTWALGAGLIALAVVAVRRRWRAGDDVAGLISQAWSAFWGELPKRRAVARSRVGACLQAIVDSIPGNRVQARSYKSAFRHVLRFGQQALSTLNRKPGRKG